MNGGKYFFNAVREGDQIMFATDDESECGLWVQAIYRATGQSHKPVPPVSQPTKVVSAQLSKVQGGRHGSRYCASLYCTQTYSELHKIRPLLKPNLSIVIRSTPPSRPNKVGFKCPPVRT